jgi:sugar transferase (PEP-CTERM/EpsH1 system associated)
MRVLFITDAVPYPPVSGNLLRVYHLVRRVAQEHEVWLATRLNKPEDAAGVDHMATFCHRVLTGERERRSKLAYVPELLRYTLAGKPFELYFEHSEELLAKIRDAMARVDFDIVHVEPSYMGLYIDELPPADYKTYLGFHNIEFSLYRRAVRIASNPLSKLRLSLHSAQLRRWEPRYAERYDRCVCVSEDDRRLLVGANPRVSATVLPNGVDTHELQMLPWPENHSTPSVVFVGSMNYAPCVDAVIWYAREILPRVRQAVGPVEMWIVGRNPRPEVQALDGGGIHVTGWVDSVEPYYARSTAVIVPLRAGGGTKLKILEAMALGRPVVSTTLGCEGIDVTDGQNILVGDTVESLAAQTVSLLESRSLRDTITANARALVENTYDWDIIARGLVEDYRQTVGDRVPVPSRVV